MNQGDVYWYTFRAPDKRRPVVILTRASALPYLSGITDAPITTTIRNIPSEVLLNAEDDGMFEICAVNTDNIQTIQKSSLDDFITRLSQERLRQVRTAIEFSLGFDALQ